MIAQLRTGVLGGSAATIAVAGHRCVCALLPQAVGPVAVAGRVQAAVLYLKLGIVICRTAQSIAVSRALNTSSRGACITMVIALSALMVVVYMCHGRLVTVLVVVARE